MPTEHRRERRAFSRLRELGKAHGRRLPANPGTVRGGVWAVLIAFDFFLMSNPLVFFPSFDISLALSLKVTAVVVVVTLPWIRVPTPPLWLTIFLGWCLLSSAWSIDGSQTIGAWWLYVQMAAIALVVGANATAQVVSQGLALGGVVIVATSWYAFVKELPGAGYVGLDGGGVVMGVGTNPNILAYTLVLSLAGALSLPFSRSWWSRVTWLVAVVTIFLGIWLARSSTGFASAAAILFAAVLARTVIMGRRPITRRAAWPILVALIGASLGVFVLIDKIFGEDVTSFSGRLPFWKATVQVSMDHPLLGSGWGAVWGHPWHPAPANAVADDIYARAGFVLTHGHNMFVDLLPEIGLVGLALAVVLLIRTVRRAANAQTRSGSERDPQPFLLTSLGLTGLLVFGLTEPMLTIPLGWWLVVILLVVRAPGRAAVPDRDDEDVTMAASPPGDQGSQVRT